MEKERKTLRWFLPLPFPWQDAGPGKGVCISGFHWKDKASVEWGPGQRCQQSDECLQQPGTRPQPCGVYCGNCPFDSDERRQLSLHVHQWEQRTVALTEWGTQARGCCPKAAIRDSCSSRSIRWGRGPSRGQSVVTPWKAPLLSVGKRDHTAVHHLCSQGSASTQRTAAVNVQWGPKEPRANTHLCQVMEMFEEE